MKQVIFVLFPLFFIVSFTSCDSDGCTDPAALNFDPDATGDDGSCVYLDEPDDNVTLQFDHVLGAQEFEFNAEVQSESGRMVKFTRAQMYLGKFRFFGSSGTQTMGGRHILIQPDEDTYPIGALPAGDYQGFSMLAGVDSALNHLDPATFDGENALSSNNPDHMHWGWDPGYIFFVVEGDVDTSAAMNGDVNAPFIFHIGLDQYAVNMAFSTEFEMQNDSTIMLNMQVDWLRLLNGMNMTADQQTRVSHTDNNFPLAELFVSNIDEVFSLED